jgi:serpin B
MFKKAICVLFAAALGFTAAGCGGIKAENLMEGITARTVEVKAADDAFRTAALEFSLSLFQHADDADQNSLISPVSALSALAMTANGARGETLSQMEQVLGGGMEIEALNGYLSAYLKSLPSQDKAKLQTAASIWIRDGLSVEREFLQTNADYYGAGAYRAPFDKTTVKDINRWVKDATDGMIKETLTEIPDEVLLYLISTVLFDAEWQNIYNKEQVRDAEFTDYRGQKQAAELMHSVESQYTEAAGARGFIKPYRYGGYDFVAVLPDEGTAIDAFIKDFSGADFAAFLESERSTVVQAAMPKFRYEYRANLVEPLKNMGMTDAFTEDVADFSGMTDAKKLFLTDAFQKTVIEVAEKGTKAAAVTVIAPSDESAPEPEEIQTVVLDRPFVYMIVDRAHKLPIFIGCVRMI